jgi:hypothetical protein
MQEQPPRVLISAGAGGKAVFPTVGVTLSQLVFWANNDTAPHQPFSPDGAFLIKTPIAPGQTSNTQAPGNAIAKLVPGGLAQGQSYDLNYTDSAAPGITGVLQLVNDFYSTTLQITLAPGANNALPLTPLIQGGLPPYTSTVEYSELPPTVKVIDGGANGPTLSGSSAAGGPWLLRVAISDSLGNSVTDTYQITVS